MCEQLRGKPELQGGYNAVGFSQGTPAAAHRAAIRLPSDLSSSMSMQAWLHLHIYDARVGGRVAIGGSAYGSA